jgi:hypothetical protein
MAGFKGDLAVEESMGSEVRIGVVMVVVLSVWLVILLGEVRGRGWRMRRKKKGRRRVFVAVWWMVVVFVYVEVVWNSLDRWGWLP